MQKQEQNYVAFISYRHVEPDMTIAKKLHYMLETYHIPHVVRKQTGTKKIGKAFRDQEELPLSQDLGNSIYSALDASQWLIIVVSPAYLTSIWCKEELNYFIKTGKKDRILVVLASGEPQDVFPEEICYEERDGKRIPIEPMSADVRAEDIAGSIKKLKKEKLRILAPILGVSFDELRRRERERKINTILKIGAAALILVSAFAIYAVRQTRVIEAQRRISAENEVQLLTEKAIGLVQNNDRKMARKYALNAYQVSETINGDYAEGALSALSAACYSGDFTRIQSLGTDGLSLLYLVFSPDDSLIACIAEQDMIACFDAGSGSMKYAIPEDGIWDSVSFSADGQKLVAVNKTNNRICVLSAETGELLNWFQSDSTNAFSTLHASFLEDGRIWALDKDESTVLDLDSNETVNSYDLSKVYHYGSPCMNRAGDRAAMVTGDGSGQVELVSPYEKDSTILETGMENISALCFTADGTGLVISDYTGAAGLIDIEKQKFIWKKKMGSETPGNISVTPDGERVLLVYDDHVKVISMEDGEEIYSGSDMVIGTGGIKYTGDGQYWFFEYNTGEMYRISDGKCYATENSILAADHKGKMLVMDEDGVLGENNMVGQGSVYCSDSFNGSLVEIPSWNALKRDVFLSSSWSDNGIGTPFLQTQMFVSPDGRFAVLINDGSYIKIWDVDKSDDVMYRCYQHTSGGNTLARDVAFTADSSLMATAGYNGCSTIFDLENGKILRVLEPARNQKILGKVKFNQDGTKVMLMEEEMTEAWIYSVQDGTQLYHLYADGEVEDFGFDTVTGDGIMLYSDGSAQIAQIFSDTSKLLEYAAELDAGSTAE